MRYYCSFVETLSPGSNASRPFCFVTLSVVSHLFGREIDSQLTVESVQDIHLVSINHLKVILVS